MSKEPKTINSKNTVEDKCLELDAVHLTNAIDKNNLLKRAHLQRNLARLTFAKSIELHPSSQTTCHLLDSDIKRYEQVVHRSGFNVADQSRPANHLFMSDCLKLLDTYCPDRSYKELRNKVWATSLSSQDQIQAFLGRTENEVIEGESHQTSTAIPPQTTAGNERTTSPDKVLSKIHRKPSTTNSAHDPIPGRSGATYNKWTAYQHVDQSENNQPDHLNNSQIEIIFPAKASIKRRKIVEEVSDKLCPAAPPSFHTATAVLQQQLNARNGIRPTTDSNSTALTQLVAPVKKSLGGRRNVQSKFVPPFLNQSTPQSYDESTDAGEIDMLDDRLKHIDPKMVELIRNEIMDTASTRVTWTDIAGLEYAKATIKEAVVWPLLRPDIFTGLRRPPRGILLFGPPGTGKTLIGKCIASQSKSTFFSISASSLTSKWIGDGEKMVRALFAVASVHQPAVVFIDEIDSLLCQRSENEHESSRRLKTEFLIQLDGAATAEDERILIVGATNRPQELDEAARRRLVKRLYIPLPELAARQQILRNLLQNERTNITSQQIDELGRLSQGFSGADMKTLCHEASMGPIRSIDMDEMEHIDLQDVRPVCYGDFELALRRVRSSVSPNDLEQYLVWDRTYGSGADEKR